ncbi:hypothetical protein Tco_0299064 [Tanacetum coccineum]
MEEKVCLHSYALRSKDWQDGWVGWAATTNALTEAYQRAKPTAAIGGTNTPNNHKGTQAMAGVVDCIARRYLAFGRHLEEIHVTWAHLEKKRTRLQTNTKTLQDLKSQSLETASPFIHDAVTLHLVTASQHFLTASARTDSTRI